MVRDFIQGGHQGQLDPESCGLIDLDHLLVVLGGVPATSIWRALLLLAPKAIRASS